MKAILIIAAVLLAIVVCMMIFASAVAIEVAGYIMKEFDE